MAPFGGGARCGSGGGDGAVACGIVGATAARAPRPRAGAAQPGQDRGQRQQDEARACEHNSGEGEVEPLSDRIVSMP